MQQSHILRYNIRALLFVALLFVIHITLTSPGILFPALVRGSLCVPAEHCNFLPTFTWSFFHGSWLHLICNSWAFLAIAFYYRPNVHQYIMAYLITAAFAMAEQTSPYIPDSLPIVGLSGFIYALLGIRCLDGRNPFRHILRLFFALISMLPGIFIPGISAMAHAFCFSLGLLVAFFTFPAFSHGGGHSQRPGPASA